MDVDGNAVSLAELLSESDAAGIRLSARNGRVVLKAPREPPDHLVQRLRDRRDELLQLVQARDSHKAAVERIRAHMVRRGDPTVERRLDLVELGSLLEHRIRRGVDPGKVRDAVATWEERWKAVLDAAAADHG